MNRKIDMLSTYIKSRHTEWKADRDELETDKWRRWYRAWRVSEDVNDKTRNSERSQLKMPATKEAVNMFLDAAMQIIFASEDWFDLSPRSLPAMEKAKITKQYLQYIFQQEGFADKVEQMLTYMGVYGWVVAQVEPEVKINKTMMKRTTFGADGSPSVASESVLEEKALFRPATKLIHPENFYISSTAKGVQADGCDGVIVRSEVYWHELLDMVAKGIIRKADADALLDPEDYGGETVVTDDERERLRHTGIYPTESGNRIELLDWWGFIPENELKEAGLEDMIEEGLGGSEMHVLVANGSTVIKATKNPYLTKERPFVKCDFEPLPNEFYGMGICEVASGPQAALDATVRSRIDNKAISINQMFAINVRKFVAGQNLKTYPGKAFLFDGPPSEALQQLPVMDVTGGSYREAQEFERYVQQATGISRILGGMPAKGGEQTAHEIQTLVRQSSGRIRRIVKRFEMRILEPIIRWYYQILFQTLNASEVFRVTNSNGVEELISITPADIVGDYDFIPQGSISMANQAKMAKTMQFLAQTANPLDAQNIDRLYLIRKVYDMMGFLDGEFVIKPPNPMQMMMQQQVGPPRIGTQPNPAGGTPQPGGIPGGPGPVMDFNDMGGM